MIQNLELECKTHREQVEKANADIFFFWNKLQVKEYPPSATGSACQQYLHHIHSGPPPPGPRGVGNDENIIKLKVY
jgi:hypothetical protein